jgi:hypothetical protein
MPAETTSNASLASQILVLLGHDPDHTPPELTAEAFRRCTRDQLLDVARRLGLTGVSKLPKEALLARVEEAFQSLGRPEYRVVEGDAVDTEPPIAGTTVSFHKFDLGPVPEEAAIPQHIPWGYGQDRVTAMAVNPDRLYAYWEITDGAMEVARRALGPGGDKAWLNLRVYDISGRLFDGTNAHSYFDHALERHDRQWFFEINKPSSTACVEVGLKSTEGYFVKIARSGRVEFPRREPVGEGPVEWLTVRTATGWAGEPVLGGPGGGPPPHGGALGGEGFEGWHGWTEGAGFPAPGGRVFERRWEWAEGGHEFWHGDLKRVEWEGPLERAEWEAGPFTYAVDPPPMTEQRDQGGELTVRTQGGKVHLVYGPWRVVIRGIGARAERRVLATWEYKRTVAVTGGGERTVAAWGRLQPGSSEWMALGASERSWLGASELVFRGASEIFLVGASELRLMGASETMYMGASELRMRGASERLLRGASELLYRGASERRLGGASESLYAGASERMGLGGSEGRLGGSEGRLGEGFPAVPPSEPPSEPLPYPETT